MTRGEVVRYARELCDVHWMREAMPTARAAVLGAFDMRGRPYIVVVFTRPASDDLPRRTGAVIVGIDQESGQVIASAGVCTDLSRYLGDPNGKPGTVNGDMPWLWPGATEDAVVSGLASVRT